MARAWSLRTTSGPMLLFYLFIYLLVYSRLHPHCVNTDHLYVSFLFLPLFPPHFSTESIKQKPHGPDHAECPRAVVLPNTYSPFFTHRRLLPSNHSTHTHPPVVVVSPVFFNCISYSAQGQRVAFFFSLSPPQPSNSCTNNSRIHSQACRRKQSEL